MLIAFASLQQPAFVAWPALAEIRTTRRVSDAMMVSLNNIKLSSRDNGDDDDDFTDEETESLFFNFDVDGNPRAGSIKPHLRTMVDAVKSNGQIGSSTAVLAKFDTSRDNFIKTTNLGDSGYTLLRPIGNGKFE